MYLPEFCVAVLRDESCFDLVPAVCVDHRATRAPGTFTVRPVGLFSQLRLAFGLGVAITVFARVCRHFMAVLIGLRDID